MCAVWSFALHIKAVGLNYPSAIDIKTHIHRQYVDGKNKFY